IEAGLDPLNLLGVGWGVKALTTGARLGSSGSRTARLTGSLLRGAGKVDIAADRVQGAVGREVIGGIGGYTASALAGGDTEQNLRAAGLGALGMNLTRGRGSLPMRAADELARVQGRAGQTPAIGGMIEA